MVHHDHAAAQNIPAELLRRHQNGWRTFTKATMFGCIAVAGLLVMMLVFLRIL